MGIYIIALYFGNSLGPLITGFIVQGDHHPPILFMLSSIDLVQVSAGDGLRGLAPSLVG